MKRAYTQHGQSKSRTYAIWIAMRRRCLNVKGKHYPYYGGRGITICARWADFRNFLADMGERPEGMTLERRNNELGYSKKNCIWATRAVQMRNTRHNNKVRFKGETLCIEEWGKRLGITGQSVRYRLRNWSIDKALTHRRA